MFALDRHGLFSRVSASMMGYSVDLLSSLLEHHSLLLQFCKDLEIAINMEKSGLELTYLTHYIKMLVNTIQEGVYPLDSKVTGFWDVATSLLSFSGSLAKLWQQFLGHWSHWNALSSMAGSRCRHSSSN